MPDFSKLKKAANELPTEGMSFARAGRMRREQQETAKTAKEQIVKQVNKIRRPDTPLAETPEPKMYN